MSKTSFTPVALGLLLSFCAFIDSSAAAQNAARPNILFVMTDDQAPWALGASGHAHAKTPNMDRLVREGAYLKNAFCVTPVCSPSRAGLMTSRYGSELGITDWINPAKEPDVGLDPATITWPELLQQAGYRTGLVGKWHLGDKPRYHPTRHGYSYFAGFLGGGTSPRDPTLEIEGRKQKVSGYTYDILTNYAIEFLRAGGEERRPFALSLHYRAPHTPYTPVPEADAAPFEEADIQAPNPDFPKLDIPRVKRLTREYLASVHGVDRNLGRLLRSLDELELSENTLVIFTSDHGYNMGHNGIWHKGNGHWVLTEPPPATPNIPRNQRPNMYDNSLRVPCIVRWPGVINPGSVVTRTVTHLDWYPTLLAAAQVEQPQDQAALVRGHSILALLRGETPEWDDDLYAEYSTHHQSRTHMRAYRTPSWKLVRDFLNSGRDELYDLTADPAETKNLIDDARPEVRQALAELDNKLLAQMRRLNDPVLGTVRDAKPSAPGGLKR